MSKNSRNEIDALLKENRRFDPPAEFAGNANAGDPQIYETAARDREAWWAKWASQLHWETPWDTVLKWEPPNARWFDGGRTNASFNCLDRHLETRGDKAALVWEGEPGDRRTLSYRDLHGEVCRLANAMKSLGIVKGDRVAIYLPLIPEAIIAMLACARIGAVHSVVFAGFSSEALRDRINDAEARLLITATVGYRRGNLVPLKKLADAALEETPSIESVVVVMRRDAAEEIDETISIAEGRDHWYHTLLEHQSRECEPEWVEAEHELFTLYTSGTTGKPKGIVHTTGGYLTSAYATTRLVFDLKDDDVFWCTADVGWVTGHTYLVYGPLSNGTTCLVYEGAPDYPDRDRLWELVAKYRATILYTAPTAIRAFMKWGHQYPERHDLSSLRLLGTVGEPINPEAWIWYHRYIGGERCPIVDTWWQTETGSIMITPLPGIVPTKPGSATLPFPGIDPAILDEAGNEIEGEGGGLLAIRSPWPSMLRGIWRDPERFMEQYWSKWEGIYFTGDGAHRDEDGYYWLLGRVDDVMNVAGHRIGTMEVESALVDHPAVAEAAVVGTPHEIKGTAISAFVTIKESHGKEQEDPAALEKTLKQHVAEKIGAIARPERILFTAELPKTRSGKIMRRLLRDIAEGKALGDVTTLADPAVVQKLKERYEDEG
ncbi:MAG: acetate--CoA ligase [Acidobacteria bacterium]|nr:acetate--CoA ligase [Acidobacteriota bacterium]